MTARAGAVRAGSARLWADALNGKGGFRPGVDLEAAVDILWLYMAPDRYHRLVHQRGWSADRFQEWLVEAMSRQLLPEGPGD